MKKSKIYINEYQFNKEKEEKSDSDHLKESPSFYKRKKGFQKTDLVRFSLMEDIRKQELQKEAVIKKIAVALQEHQPNSEGKTLKRMTTFIKDILEEVKNADLKKITYSACLDKIIEQFNALFNSIEGDDCSAEDAWFLWKHAHLSRIHFHYSTQPSAQAQEFLSLAKRIGKLANQLVFRGGETDLINNEKSEEEVKIISKKVDEERDLVADELEEVELFTSECSEAQLRVAVKDVLSARMAEKTGYGNCHEKARVALNLLKDFPAEIFKIGGEFGDHIFIVIGRLSTSDPGDYTTWGPNAVICDPWADQYYFAREIPEKLKNLVTLASPEGRDKLVLEPFHPHYHTLERSTHINTFKHAKEIVNEYEAAKKELDTEVLVQPVLTSSSCTPLSFQY